MRFPWEIHWQCISRIGFLHIANMILVNNRRIRKTVTNIGKVRTLSLPKLVMMPKRQKSNDIIDIFDRWTNLVLFFHQHTVNFEWLFEIFGSFITCIMWLKMHLRTVTNMINYVNWLGILAYWIVALVMR